MWIKEQWQLYDSRNSCEQYHKLKVLFTSRQDHQDTSVIFIHQRKPYCLSYALVQPKNSEFEIVMKIQNVWLYAQGADIIIYVNSGHADNPPT